MKFLLKYQLIFLILVFIANDINAQNYTVSGYIIDSASKETLIGAVIIDIESNKGVVSDGNGYFQLPGLKKGNHFISFSHVGYNTHQQALEITNRSILVNEVRLSMQVQELQDVTVVASKSDIIGDRRLETSMMKLSSKTISSIPTAGNDVFKAVKFLPGIDRTEPSSPLFTVRGSDPGENAVLLDGVMIYNPYHSSITSGIFNTQTIKNVDLLVGGFGAEYGGRNSAFMYITTKDGSSDKIHGELEPSTFHSKGFIEFPVGEKGTAMIAGRYYYDIFSAFILHNNSYFYDFNVSYTYRLNQKNRLTLKYFQSKDHTGISFNTFYKYIGNTFEDLDFYRDLDLRMKNNWSNIAATLIHKCILTPRIYLRTQLYYSGHRSDNLSTTAFQYNGVDDETSDTMRISLQTSSNFVNEIFDYSAKTQLTINISKSNILKLGAEINRYYFKNSAQINLIDQGELKQSPLLFSGYAEDKWEFGRFIIRPGIRITKYSDMLADYEPRINAAIILPASIRFKLAYGIYYQHVISMNTNEVEMSQSVDYYYPLKNYKPSKSIHYIASIEKDLNANSSVSLDVYYKDLERIYTFDINQASTQVITLSEKLQQGSGEAYGAELILKGGYKNVSGWIAYCLSWATRSYPFINKGKSYPYDYNNRHTIKAVVNYSITKSLEYNASLVYLSGVYRSIEETMQNYFYYDPELNNISMFPIWISNSKNNAKMPPRINLDMSIKKRLRSGFGKQMSEVLNTSESYVTVTIRNILFLYRNVDYYFPIGGSIERYKGKYIPFGSNYLPSVGFSYTLKF